MISYWYDFHTGTRHLQHDTITSNKPHPGDTVYNFIKPHIKHDYNREHKQARIQSLVFPSISDAYERARPGYNTDSVEFLLGKVGAFKTHSASEPFTIVELGAGTGKFTRAALCVFEKRSVKNVKIIATEPIKEMCEKFKETVPTIEIRQRPAHNLGKQIAKLC